MAEQAVRVERSGPVSTVLLYRPARRNAVDGPTAAQLAAAFRAFDADPDSAVAVLHGEGGVFCSGADLTAIGSERGNRAAPDGDGPMGVSRLRLSKPVIAAVSGYAVAGGLELALWCDLRVADETATFGVFCRRWGVPLIDGGTVRLPRLIGTSRAMDMILTGRAVDAQEAAAIGLANRVVPAGQALGAAQELAAQLAAFPQVCLRSDRASVLDQEGLDETAALASEFAHGRAALAAETASGAARFAAGAGRHGSFSPGGSSPLPAGPGQKLREHRRITACHLDDLGAARHPGDERNGAAADAECAGHRGQRGLGRLAVHGARADLHDQGACALAADGRMRGAGPHPDRDSHITSVAAARAVSCC
jgi:enoyl-CoA hydratase